MDTTILSLEFSYRSKTYYGLVRIKMNEGVKCHHVTVMNGDLERLLYGYHIIAEDRDGLLHPVAEAPDEEVQKLQDGIIQSLQRSVWRKEYKGDLHPA
jgi:hypothetical protein